MFGFTFLENFEHPYESQSVTEFWRRWHISMGTWFREYVYIPLGGNRCAAWRQILNLLIVWALTGLWHGAGWNFVLWGLYYGAILILEKLVLKKFLQKLPRAVRHIYTLILVVLGWVLFAVTDFGLLGTYLAHMFSGAFADGMTGYLLLSNGVLLVLAVIGSTTLPKRLWLRMEARAGERVSTVLRTAGVVLLLCASIAFLAAHSYSPFLYFRF